MLWELRIKSFHSLFSIKTAYFTCVCSQTQQKMHQKIHLFANISANSHFSHNKYTKKCILHFSLQEIFLKFFFHHILSQSIRKRQSHSSATISYPTTTDCEQSQWVPARLPAKDVDVVVNAAKAYK